MKKLMIFSIMVLVNVQATFCQMSGLKGSGKILTRTFDFQNFETIQLDDLDGKIEIIAGKPYSISVAIDDNLESLLQVSSKNKTLFISLYKNKNNKRYIENANIKITINVPLLNQLGHNGNSDVFVTNVDNASFSVKSTGNGNLLLSGVSEKIEIEKAGNGDVDAGKLTVKDANIISVGNGNVIVFAGETFNAAGTGNGDIINKGKPKPSATSKQIGNGEIINN